MASKSRRPAEFIDIPKPGHGRPKTWAATAAWFLAVLAFAMAPCLACLGGEPERATVRLGTGCSGVCVDPSGIVLTAKHCGAPESTRVFFPGGEDVRAVLVHQGPNGDDVVAYDCDGAGFPFVDVASEKPEPGDDVWSLGYPARAMGRQVRGSGKLFGVGPAQVFDPHAGYLDALVNGTTIQVGGGWSGGPLFNADAQVVGILSSEHPRGSQFLSYQDTVAAYQVAQAARPAPRLRYFGYAGCEPCLYFKRDAKAGKFGRVLGGKLDAHGDVLETTRYRIEYVDIETKDGRAKFVRLGEALKALGKPVPKVVPTFHLEGRAAATTGYDTRKTNGRGFRRLGGWLLETLRLPLTLGEGVLGAITPDEPEDLGESAELPPLEGEPDLGEFEPALEPVPDPISTPAVDEPGLVERVKAAAVTAALDRVQAKLAETAGQGDENDDDEPVPWGGGLAGMALAALELWRRKAA